MFADVVEEQRVRHLETSGSFAKLQNRQQLQASAINKLQKLVPLVETL
jgi:hypothetical protein